MDMRQQQAERYREPSFEEAVDIADEVRQWRRERRKVIAMRVVAALLIILAIGIGGFPMFLHYQSALELRNPVNPVPRNQIAPAPKIRNIKVCSIRAAA